MQINYKNTIIIKSKGDFKEVKLNSSPITRNYSRSSSTIRWDCKGWSIPDKEHLAAKPCGSTAHKKGYVVLETYHYTRTYVGSFNGDSGREWGNYTVTAYGEMVDMDIWNRDTHYVKYGTTDD